MAATEVICGTHAVLEAIRAGKRRVFEVYISSGKAEKMAGQIEDEARRQKIPCQKVSGDALYKMSRIEKNQGVAAKVESYKYTSEDEIFAQPQKNPFFLILDQVTDPQNLGSLLRSAHLCGVDAVFIPKDNSAGIGPAAARASAGAAEYLQIVQVTNLVQLIKVLKEKNIWVVGADGDTEQSLYDFDAKGAVALVMGSEGKGMRPLVKETCDLCLKIPMTGVIGSFNVSVAGAIMMSEFHRQRILKK
ncbi:MAG: 23S rRNA (guanosine(2251)-2'-O)-methyltransferase RlmB [Deltaproteobacteria bacterium CG11_big_fil_rev_8_21_14_0_20_47_16]|nr:MAG: 23S rRNA (guanosine(2251)-2'-O)-methyltransferase RlmB [Deltaproteobacteria bacterium CG11_big_fil_rev_8_21_14_0_20_47_16]